MARKKYGSDTPTQAFNLGTGEPIQITAMEKLGHRILACRKRIGMTQSELAAELGMTANAVSMWEHGKARPDLENIVPLCKALRITPSQLFGSANAVTHEELELLKDYRRLFPVNQKVILTAIAAMLESQEKLAAYRPLLPLRRSANFLSAGIGDYEDIWDEPDLLMVHDTPLTRRAAYVFPVNGDSMEPEYHDKDLVLVEQADPSLLMPGMIAAFRADGVLYIKQYLPNELHSLNPEYRSFAMDEFGQVTLIGRVIGTLQEEDLASEQELEAYRAVNSRS